MGLQKAHQKSNESGHFLAADTELADRVNSMSLQEASARRSQDRVGSSALHQAQPFLAPASGMPQEISTGADANGSSSQVNAGCSEIQPGDLDDSSASTSGRPAVHQHTPSWEQKGKAVMSGDEEYKTPPRPQRPSRGLPVSSRASSGGSSPSRSGGPGSSHRGSPSAASASPLGSPDVKSIAAALASKSADAQIRALKKLRLDMELCRCLTEEERGVAALVKLLSPAKRWLPSFGCTDLQTTAAAALVSLAKVPTAREQIAAAGGITALVQLLGLGSAEAQSHAAKALATLAEDPALGFQVGQAGGCSPLVRMLTSATALHSSFVSFQMTADHEEAQAHAAVALANLASTSANQAKITEAGGIAPLVLLLSTESAALQAAAARCLHSLASDPDIAARIVDAGALGTLLSLLELKDPQAKAAAAQAVGVMISDERTAATAIPRLVKMMAHDLAEVRAAAAQGLANLAHNSTINKVKVAGEAACIPALVQQMLSAEMQVKLAARLNSLKSRVREAPLLTLLESVLGKPGLRSLSKLAQQVKVPLNNQTDVPTLVAALKTGVAEEQLAVARLLSSLTVDGFSQSKVFEAGINCLLPLTRLLRSESIAVRGKAAAALANLAAADPEAVRRTACEESLVLAAAGPGEARPPALRCLLNLSDDEDSLDALVAAGCVPVLLSVMTGSSTEAQKLAASVLANLAVSPMLRKMVVRGGGIQPLVRLLGGDIVKVQVPAAAALWQLSGDKTINEEIGVLGGPKAAVHALQAKSSALQENAAGLIASMAQNRHNAAILAEEGAVENLLPLLRSRTTEVQAYAAESLRGIAGVSDEQRISIARDSIPTLTLLLGSPLADAQQSAAGCLASLAANSEVRTRIGQAGAVPHLVHLLCTGRSQAKVAAATALTNLAINNSANLKEFVRAGGILPLKQLLNSDSSAARRAAEGALSSLAGGSRSPAQIATPRRVDSPSSSQDHEDPGTPSATLMKRRSWRSPSMVLDHELPHSPRSDAEQ